MAPGPDDMHGRAFDIALKVMGPIVLKIFILPA